MKKESRDFLVDLLNTPSPSGKEAEIQQKWAGHVKEYADELQTDGAGNVLAIINPKAKFKVLVAAHCDEITKVGGISPKLAPGMKVEVLGYKKRISGIVGVNPEHFGDEKDKVEFEDLYIDCGARSKEEVEQYARFGDFIVYKREPELLLNEKISGRALDNRTGIFMMAELLKNLAKKRPDVGVYIASTTSEEVNMQGAYGAGAGIIPDLAIICDVNLCHGSSGDQHE